MSLTSCSYNRLEENAVDKILEQGQKLRKAMVQSILDYDPFNTDVIKSATTMDLVKSRLRNKVPSQTSSSSNYSTCERDKLMSFFKGDTMSRKDEMDALVKLQCMSSKDLCKTANEAYSATRKCSCKTCLKYKENDLNCDLQRSNRSLSKHNEKQEVQEKHVAKQNKYFKYVDSLRVTVHDLILNENGNKKVAACSGNDKRVPVLGSQTFFIEYELPFILSVATHRKVHRRSTSNVKNNSFIRICARRLSTEAVTFKQTSLHNIRNVDQINLEGIEMKFQICCRTMRQKTAIQLGYAVFNFAEFELSSSLTCTEKLTINFNDKIPIILGHLSVTLEMGCGKLYFGKEFIASIEGTSNSGKKEDQELLKICEKKPTVSPRFTNRIRDPTTLTSQGDSNEEDSLIKSSRRDKQKSSDFETVRVYEVNN